jgi:hypothetical protein
MNIITFRITKNVQSWVRKLTEAGQKPYEVDGSWFVDGSAWYPIVRSVSHRVLGSRWLVYHSERSAS